LGTRAGVSKLLTLIISFDVLTKTSDDFIPIPGTKRVKYFDENVASINVTLSKEEAAEVRKTIESVGGGKGDRYPAALMSVLFGDSPERK
jgi:diketogulonate reductase-like aldo/keto reductase